MNIIFFSLLFALFLSHHRSLARSLSSLIIWVCQMAYNFWNSVFIVHSEDMWHMLVDWLHRTLKISVIYFSSVPQPFIEMKSCPIVVINLIRESFSQVVDLIWIHLSRRLFNCMFDSTFHADGSEFRAQNIKHQSFGWLFQSKLFNRNNKMIKKIFIRTHDMDLN